MSRRGAGEGSIFFDAARGHWVGKLPREQRGRRQRVTGRTRREVQQGLRDAMRRRERGQASIVLPESVGEFLTRWAADTLPVTGRAPRTIQSYEAAIRLHLVPGLGGTKLQHLTPEHLQRFIREHMESGTGPAGSNSPSRCCERHSPTRSSGD